MKSISFSSELIPSVLDDRKTQTRRLLKPQPPSIEAVDALAGSGGFSIFTDRHSESPAHFRVGGPVWAVRQLIGEPANSGWVCPYGAPGERLWVRETHYRFGHWEPKEKPSPKTGRIGYRFVADSSEVWFPENRPDDYGISPPQSDAVRATPRWYCRLGRFMPRVLSRTTLEVTGVRVERLQDISEADARAEGIELNVQREHWRAVRVLADESRELMDFERCPSAAVVDELRLEEVTHVRSAPMFSAQREFERLWRRINGGESWEANRWVWVVSFKRVAP